MMAHAKHADTKHADTKHADTKHAAAAAAEAPAPLVAPPQPKGIGSLRTLKKMHNDWVTAGGTSIYGPVTLPPPDLVTTWDGGSTTWDNDSTKWVVIK